MNWTPVLLLTSLAALAAILAFTHWGMRWGASSEERTARMPGDFWIASVQALSVRMTRAISIAAPPESVWGFLAQQGRGAGWYSFDWLDNGRRASAQHLVSWIPEPRIGDATAIGYLRHLTPGNEMTWWAPGGRFLGANTWLCTDIRLRREGRGTRLVIRVSARATGRTARPVLYLFRFLDSVMSMRQLLGIRRRAERTRDSDPDPKPAQEGGAWDQFQLYEVVYASGLRAGVPGREDAGRWHRSAIHAGLIRADELREGQIRVGPVRVDQGPITCS